MEKQFNPMSSEFKKVEHLPVNERAKYKDVDGGFVRQNAIEDVEKAHNVAEREREMLKELRNLDLSSISGRKKFHQIFTEALSKDLTIQDIDGKSIFPVYRPFIISNINTLTRIEYDIFPIKKDDVLQKYAEWSGVFGHGLIKQPHELIRVLLGKELQEDLKNSDLITQFTYIISEPHKLASDSANNTLNGRLLYVLNKLQNKEGISDEEIKKHPNYPKAEELIVKAGAMTEVVQDIIFKILSSFVHTSRFSSPDIFSNLEENKKNEILEKIVECQSFYDELMDGEKRQAWNAFMRMETEMIKSYEFNQEIDKEQDEIIQYIDYFSPIINGINNQMQYSGIENKK